MQRLVRTAFLWLILLPLPVHATTPVQPPEDTAAASPAAAAPPKADPQLPWVTRQADVPRVSFHRFHSAVAGTDVSYHLYTPLEYDQFPDRRFPVLYWLHGTEGGINHIRPVARLFHFGIRDHGLPPLLVVFVNGLSKRLWTDSKDGRAPIESVFIRDLIPQIAIANITLVPGSNPVYGLNTLGGAVSINTKSGFAFPGSTFQNYESATVRVAADGSVHVMTGIQNIGQGIETAYAQVAADALGCALEIGRAHV